MFKKVMKSSLRSILLMNLLISSFAYYSYWLYNISLIVHVKVIFKDFSAFEELWATTFIVGVHHTVLLDNCNLNISGVFTFFFFFFYIQMWFKAGARQDVTRQTWGVMSWLKRQERRENICCTTLFISFQIFSQRRECCPSVCRPLCSKLKYHTNDWMPWMPCYLWYPEC